MILSSTANDLEEIVANFERAARQGTSDFAEFLPTTTSALYPLALRELVRVDMELSWSADQPRFVDDYLKRFPILRTDEEGLGEICFEEFRLRQIAGEHPDASVYRQRFQVDTSRWPIENAVEFELAERATDYLRQSVSGISRLNAKLTHDAPTRLFADLHQTDPMAARNLAEALTNFPEVGQSIAGYDLLDELGRGAFSRVYLARERAVDGRHVALKMTGDMRSEIRALARLRHTNIIPVYSVKESGPFHVMCMPFCGSATLADIVRRLNEEKGQPKTGASITRFIHRDVSQTTAPLLQRLNLLSFVEAVLELAIRIARGLAHAHERGICHRDLKPANVLLADDGEPLLLDFNLAAEMHRGGLAVAAYIGGTLPYMAPEQLRAFRGSAHKSDTAADVYSLGLVLYEVLAGQLPTTLPSGTVDECVDYLIEERSVLPRNLHEVNPAVSPSLAAIIGKCLARDPAQRYVTATELADDLTRQGHHQPLRFAKEPSGRERLSKWSRRHPRLSSATALATVAAALLVGVGTTAWSIHRDRATIAERENLRLFQDEFQIARMALSHPAPDPETLQRGIDSAAKAWNRVSEKNQEKTRERGQLAFLQAHALSNQAQSYPTRRSEYLKQAEQWNHRAQALLGPTSELVAHQAKWLDQLKTTNTPDMTEPNLASTSDLDIGWWLLRRNRGRDSLKHLTKATNADPDSVNAWFLRGMAEKQMGRLKAAEASLSTCIALNPHLSDGYQGRAIVLTALGRNQEAIADLNTALERQPASLSILVNRGIAKFASGDLAGAEADLTAAIVGGYPETRLYFLRARVRDKIGNRNGADADRKSGFEFEPITEDDWLAHSVARLPKDPEGALKDLDHCLQRFPRSHRAWENKAHIYDAYLRNPSDSIGALDEAIRIAPDSAQALAGRGVLKARNGDFSGARADAVRSLDAVSVAGRANAPDLDDRPDILYQVAGIYALTSKNKPTDLDRCLFLLSRAIQHGYGWNLVDNDPELTAVRFLPEVKRLVAEAKKWEKISNLAD